MGNSPGQDFGLGAQLDAALRDLCTQSDAKIRRVLEIWGCPLSECPRGTLLGDGDLVAGVVSGTSGALRGSAILGMEPELALVWLADAPTADPLAAFVQRGEALLRAVVEALARRLGVEASTGPGALQEEPLLALVLGTHAPSDTLVLSAVLEAPPSADVGSQSSVGPLLQILLVLEPKLLGPLVPRES